MTMRVIYSRLLISALLLAAMIASVRAAPVSVDGGDGRVAPSSISEAKP
jgi:hypothetical protein